MQSHKILSDYIFIFTLLNCSLLTNCDSANQQQPAQVQSSDSVVIDKQENQQTQNIDEAEPDIAYWRKKFIDSYDQISQIDTFGIIQGDTLHIHLKHYCLKDSAIQIPKEYIFDKQIPKFTTHNFAAELTISSKQDTSSLMINKDSFIKYVRHEVENDIVKYGVLQDPRYRGIDAKEQLVKVEFTWIIPVTDVGFPLICEVDYKKGIIKRIYRR